MRERRGKEHDAVIRDPRLVMKDACKPKTREYGTDRQSRPLHHARKQKRKQQIELHDEGEEPPDGNEVPDVGHQVVRKGDEAGKFQKHVGRPMAERQHPVENDDLRSDGDELQQFPNLTQGD